MQVEHDLIGTYPLSPQQRRLWSLQQPWSSAYVVQAAIAIEGPLDREVLHLALQDVVASREVLRTIFIADGSQTPLQGVAANRNVELHDHDFSGLEISEQEERLSTLLRDERQQISDTSGPRFILVDQASMRSTLLVTFSPLQADAAMLVNLVHEIGKRYSARMKHEDPTGGAVQYADLSEWQNGMLEEEAARRERELWRRQLDLPSLSLRMPLELEAPTDSPFRPESVSVRIEHYLVAALDELSATYRISPSVLLLTCWQVLLYRLTRQSRLTVGVALDGRNYEGLEGALGPLTKYLPLLTKWEGNERFSECLARVADSLETLSELQEYFSWEHVLTEREKPATTPYIPVCYDYNVYNKYQPPEIGLTFSIANWYACVDRFKIRLSCARTDNTLITEFLYDTALFDRAAIERLSNEFHTVLRSVVDDADCSIAKLRILGDEERRQMLEDFNRIPTVTSRELPMHRLFEEQAARTPDASAVSCGKARLTYAELDHRAERVAEQLRDSGVAPGVLVGLCVRRSVEMLVGILSIWKAGGAYVPLDPEYPPDRLRAVVSDAGLRAVVTWGKTEALAHAAVKDSGADVILMDWSRDAVNQGAKKRYINTEAHANDLAYVIYTSGSTGVPKGVCVEHRSLVSYLGWVNEVLLSGAVRSLPVVTSLSFDMCLKQLLPPLLTGGEVWLLPDEVVVNPDELVRALCARPQFGFNCVPSLWSSILDSLDPGQMNGLRERLVLLAFGGERLSQSLVEQTFALLPRVQLWNIYGPTEVTANATATVIESGEAVTIGCPISNTRVYILNEYLEPVPIGVVGEIYVGGSGVARGYQSRPDLTAESFIPDPFGNDPGRRLYKTGDQARFLSDGKIDFTGRVDHQVKVRGYRIELGEIEKLLEQHQEVGEAVVVVREDIPGEVRLVGYVTSGTQRVPTVEELREYLQTKLPSYMAPNSLVVLKSLPRTPNGKVDRRTLPEPERVNSSGTSMGPRTPEERLLAEVWAEVLGLKTEVVGIEDNFFELGGDSILSIQVVARAGRRGLRITPRQMFEHQTIARLAAAAVDSRPASASPLAVNEAEIGQDGEAPLTPIQRRFFEQQPDPHHFNQAVLLRTHPGLSTDVLERALALLVARHDALRLRFHRDESGKWQQHIAGMDQVNERAIGDGGLLWRRDLTGVTEEDKFVSKVELECALAQASLNLEHGPILRAVHFCAGEKRWGRFFIAIHHLAVDGVSWRVLLEELSEAVEALAAGREPVLAEKTATWLSWSRELVGTAEKVKRELGHWRSLPWSRVQKPEVDAEGVNTILSVRTVEHKLTQSDTAELLNGLATAYRARVDDALLSALVRAYSRWLNERGTEDDGGVLLVNVEGHGRELGYMGMVSDPTRTVGWFTSLYPVAFEIGDPEENVEGALLRTKEAMRAVPNGGVGWGLLRYVCDGDGLEEVRRWPRAVVCVNYLGRFDNVVTEAGPFAAASEPVGPLQSERGMRQYLLEINSMVMNEQLHVSWAYSENMHRRESVEHLVDLHAVELHAIIEHCQSPEAGGFTPSDFPEAKLNQEELDAFLSSIGGRRS